MRVLRMRWLGLAAIALMAACGGGGGGDGGGTEGGGGTGFNATNAALVAAEGSGAAFTGSDIADFAEVLFTAWTSIIPAARVAGRSSNLLVDGVCETGTVDVVWTDADSDMNMSVGDTGAFTFSNCVISDDFGPETYDGILNLEVTAQTGVGVLPFSITMAFTFGSAFTIDDVDSLTQLTGGFDFSMSSSDGDTFKIGLNGSSLSITESGAGGTYTATLSNFTTTITSTDSTGAYSIVGDGTLFTSDLGMTVQYQMTTPFSGNENNVPEEPEAGEMVITEGGGGIITVTVVDRTSVDVALDADGDGTPEVTTRVLWDDL